MSEHDEKCEYELWSGPSCECGCAYRALEKAYEGQARTIQEKAQRIAELEAYATKAQSKVTDLAHWLKEKDNRIAELEADNAALAAWQCPYTDGKEGLVCDEHGHQYCAKHERIAELEGGLRMAGQLALDERWNERFPLVFSAMEQALGGDDD